MISFKVTILLQWIHDVPALGITVGMRVGAGERNSLNIADRFLADVSYLWEEHLESRMEL